MNSRMNVLFAAAVVALSPALLGINLLRTNNRNVEQGNAEMRAGKAADALKLYDKALSDDGLSDPQARAAAEFNRGVALSALGKPDEAGQAFLESTKSKDTNLRARAFYNLGNTFFKGEKFAEAIEAFKRSLILDPRGQDAKWNLELALRRKKEQDEKNKDKDKDKKGDDKKDDKDNDKKDGDQKQDSGDKDQNKPSDKSDKPGEQDQQDQKDKQDKDPTKPNEPDKGQDGQNGQNDKAAKNDQKPPEPPAPAGQDQAQPQAPKPDSADMKEMNAVLDSLEQSPRQIEQQRARVRAMQRRAPVKDW